MQPAGQIDDVLDYLSALHAQLCAALERADGGASFVKDPWTRARQGDRAADAAICGHGHTSILRGGAVFEQAGVGFSNVYGDHLPRSASTGRPELAGASWRAAGVSLVLHPRNPYLPVAHLNVRHFRAQRADETIAWWFGGGFDLTPCYPFDEDVLHWHRVASQLCAPFGETRYAEHKRWCDGYFFLQHRGETRGVGGLFFDDLHTDFERDFAYLRAVGHGFLDAYLPIVERRSGMPWGDRERQFQLYRRGRYVEFNLICDRGTLFGLQSGGRTESILMSLPPLARWEYGHIADPGSPEARLQDYLRPRDWLKELG